MNVDFMYRLVQYITAKNQQGYVTPNEFNDAINQAQYSYVNYLVGQYQQYLQQRPVSRVTWGGNSNVRQSLSPVIYGYVLSVNVYGFSAYPGDYQKMDSLVDVYGTKPIRWAAQDNVTEYINSRIDPIATNPVYTMNDTGFTFYPNSIGTARLSYVRKPPDIIWGYTLDVNGEPVYDAATSQDCIFFDIDCFEIIVRALRMIGVNLQAAEVSQYAETIKQGGQ